MHKIKIFKTAHDYVLWCNETIRNLLYANFVCYFIDEENVQIIKDRYDTPSKTVDYAEFLKRLERHDKALYMKYNIKKLAELAQKYNVTIITATQPKDLHLGGKYIDYPSPHVILLDYFDTIKSK